MSWLDLVTSGDNTIVFMPEVDRVNAAAYRQLTNADAPVKVTRGQGE